MFNDHLFFKKWNNINVLLNDNQVLNSYNINFFLQYNIKENKYKLYFNLYNKN